MIHNGWFFLSNHSEVDVGKSADHIGLKVMVKAIADLWHSNPTMVELFMSLDEFYQD